MKTFLFAVVFVILNSQGKARPMDTYPDGAISLMLPRTMQQGYSITLKGILNDQSERISVLLPAADADDCKIVYNYENHIMEVTPGVEGYNTAKYEIKKEGGAFLLELTVRFNKYGSAELNVTFSVNGIDMVEPLYLDVSKCLDSINSIIFEEGVKTINTLSFEFEKST